MRLMVHLLSKETGCQECLAVHLRKMNSCLFVISITDLKVFQRLECFRSVTNELRGMYQQDLVTNEPHTLSHAHRFTHSHPPTHLEPTMWTFELMTLGILHDPWNLLVLNSRPVDNCKLSWTLYQLSYLTHPRNAGINLPHAFLELHQDIESEFKCPVCGNRIGQDGTQDPLTTANQVEHFTNWAIWPTKEMLEQISHMLSLSCSRTLKVSLSVLCVVMELAGIELKTLWQMQIELSTLPIELSDPPKECWQLE